MLDYMWSQRTTGWSWFFFSTFVWVPEIKIRLQVYMADAFVP